MARKFRPDPTRLCEAVERAALALRQPRRNRFNLVKLFTGTRYSEEGAGKIQPINMLSLYVDVVSRQLVANAPRAMLSTFSMQAKPTVVAEQDWLNKEIVKTRMDRLFQRAVVDYLFGIGIIKVGIATPAESATYGFDVDAGEPFAETVDFDDFVVDMHARNWESVGYMGNRLRRPLEVIKEDKNYQRGRKDLQASPDSIYNQHGEPRVSIIGRTVYQTSEQEFEDYIDLWEIYLPQHRCIYTFVCDDSGRPQLCEDGEPLREQDWIGPDHGPYHIMTGQTVPGNLLPKAPLQDLADQHEVINLIYRKLIDQSQRQKTLLFVRGAADADGKRTIDANDGDSIRVDDPAGIKEWSSGGPNQQNFAMFVDAVQRFNYIAGNIEASGGLSKQSNTATQDKMLEASASGAIATKQEITVAFVEEVLTTLVWFHHHHPTKTMRSMAGVPGMPEIPGVQVNVTPQQRAMIPWEELDVKVNPYSMRHSTPETRANDLSQIVMQIVMPLMPALQAAGVQFDIQAFLKKIGQYKDMPDLGELITIREPPQDPGGASGPDATAAPNQPTTYQRVSSSERSQRGTDMNLAATLMSGKSQGGANGTANGQSAH